MASIVCQKLGVLPPNGRLCRQLELHPKTTQIIMQTVEHGFGKNPGFGFNRIIRKPHALATEVSLKEPKVN